MGKVTCEAYTDRGVLGKSAYEQAIEGGYTGTEEEFNIDLANGATYAGNARKWAEGSDADVSPLGGTHSSKGWAQEAEQVVSSKANTALSNLTQESTFNVLKPQNTLMYVNTAGVIATIGGRNFYKANADGCYAALFLTTDGFRMPVLVGETAESVMGYDDVDTTPRNPTGSFVWNGKTWYYQVSFYAMVDTFDYASSLPCLRGRHIPSGTEPAQALLDLQFSTPKNALPVEVYQNGSSWYRVYSDGWCEQGGVFSTGADATATLNLLKEYRDTNYQVWYCGCGTNTNTVGASWINQIIYPETTATVTYRVINYTRWWKAVGYIN